MIFTVAYEIIALAVPLLLVSFAALISEHTGRMALFLDGMINFAAFLCFTFTVCFKNVFSSILVTCIICMLIIYMFDYVIQRFKANSFIAAMAINLLLNSLVSFFSVKIFGTRGVLTSEYFTLNTANVRMVSTIVCLLILVVMSLFLRYSKAGLYIRITGNDSEVLKARGVNPTLFCFVAWIVAAFMASISGCVLTLRLSSFVPNISSGIGWTALAAVFMGKKNTAVVLSAVLIFSTAEYIANNIQNISSLSAMPSFILLALPYLISLLFILLSPKK